MENQFFDANLRKNNLCRKYLSIYCKKVLACFQTFFSESCFLLGKVQLTLTCFQMWLVVSLKHLHEMLKRNRKSNSNFFDVNLPNRRSFRRIILFSALPERLIVFKYGIWAQTVLSKKSFNLEYTRYRVWCDFAKEAQRHCNIKYDLSRKYLRFNHCSAEVVLKCVFWDFRNVYIKCLFELWGKIIISWAWICKGTILSTVFVFSALPSELLMLNNMVLKSPNFVSLMLFLFIFNLVQCPMV